MSHFRAHCRERCECRHSSGQCTRVPDHTWRQLPLPRKNVSPFALRKFDAPAPPGVAVELISLSSDIADDYQLTPSEIAELFGTAAEYRISEVADRNAGVVLKINKERLTGLADPIKK